MLLVYKLIKVAPATSVVRSSLTLVLAFSEVQVNTGILELLNRIYGCSADMFQPATMFLTLVTIWLLFGKSEAKSNSERLSGHPRISPNLPLLHSLALEEQLFEEDEDIPHPNKRQKFDDYGHMRFGKRDQFEDYGHFRFGRNRL